MNCKISSKSEMSSSQILMKFNYAAPRLEFIVQELLFVDVFSNFRIRCQSHDLSNSVFRNFASWEDICLKCVIQRFLVLVYPCYAFCYYREKHKMDKL